MKLLIVDDHAILREGLTALLGQLDDDTTIVTAADGLRALETIESDPDIEMVVLDLAMPGLDGVQVIENLGVKRPDLPIIVLSASEDPADVRRAISLGAVGYVPKSAAPQTLIAAIQLVRAGEVYVPTLLLNDGSPIEPASAGPMSKLTQRQLEVLDGLCRGMPNKTIAVTLNMSEKTVKAHITMILRALGAANRTQAVAIAQRMTASS